MKQVFLIHAHKDLAQLNALLARLRDPDFALYVHLDRKWKVDPALVDPAARQVHPRLDVRWGSFGQVGATLASLRQVLAREPAFDKLLFLSAQDYPVLSNDALKEQLAALQGAELIDAVRIGPHGWPASYRYEYFYSEGSALPLRLACALANRSLRLAALGRLDLVGAVAALPARSAGAGRPAARAGAVLPDRPVSRRNVFPDAGDGFAVRVSRPRAQLPLRAMACRQFPQSADPGRGRLRAHPRIRRAFLPQARRGAQCRPARPA
jgi:hypothetical protein